MHSRAWFLTIERQLLTLRLSTFESRLGTNSTMPINAAAMNIKRKRPTDDNDDYLPADVVSDSKGASRSDIGVTITKLDRSTVRVSSDYRRLGTVDVTLTRSGNMIIAAAGDTPFIVDLDRNPPTLDFTPHNEVAYRGNKQK